MRAARLRCLGRAAGIVSSCAVLPAPAAELPFDASNLSPLVQIHGLPGLGPARVADPGRTRLGVHYEAASHLVDTGGGAEALRLDGETHRTTLRVFHGLGRSAEAGIELPYLTHSGGFLDGFIENWHDAFGLPQGGRDAMPSDQLLYHYRRDGVDRIHLTQATAGVGDVRIGGAVQLTRAEDGGSDGALRASLKLATGDSAQLHGSGAADVAVWASLACGRRACHGAFSWYGGGGLLWLGSGDILPEQQRRGVAFGSAGVHWRAAPTLALTAQVDAHTPFYKDTGVRPLKAPSAQLILGGTWFVRPALGIQVAVAEDIVVDTAPDVTLHLGIQAYF